MQPAVNPRRWTALAVIALAQFMVIMDTSHHRRRPARDPHGPRLQPRGPLMGLQRLRHRLRRPAAARRPALRPVRRQAHLHRRLGRARRRIAGRRARRLHRRRNRRARRSGRRLGAHRAVRADPADDALRLQPEGAHEGVRRLRRRRPRRRHRRRVPRRRHHRVGLMAVGVLHQHPGGPRRPRADAAADAGRARAARFGRPRRRDPGHGRARGAGLRHRPRPRAGLGLDGDHSPSGRPVSRRSRCSSPSRPAAASR